MLTILGFVLSVHIERGKVDVRDIPIPRPRRGEALIRLLCAGICNTDIELLQGYYDFRGIPGHEFVGLVEQATDKRWVGRRVVGEINLPCGKCSWCTRGLGRHCPRRKVLGISGHPGVFSEYFTLPESNLHAVPPSVPEEHAVFTEPIAAACEILEQVRLPPAAQVAVLGDGKLGLLIAQVLAHRGYQVTLFGKHPHKLRIARLARVRARKLPQRIPHSCFPFVVEATGSPAGLAQAIHMVQPRGTVVLKTTVHEHATLDTAPVVVNEVTIIGSRCGRFPPALRLLSRGKLRLQEMISATFPLSQAPQAFEYAQRPGVLKVLLRPG